MSKIALFAMIFASLAPSIVHALAAQNTSIVQEVCTSKGNKLVIQVITSQGKQLATEFNISKTQPKNSIMHLEHCPFCSAGGAAAALPSQPLEIITRLAIITQKTAKYATPVVVSAPYALPPSQAPPSL